MTRDGELIANARQQVEAVNPNPAHRPAADPDNPRNTCLRVMVSPAEAEAVKAAANADAQQRGTKPSVSAWIGRLVRDALKRL